MKIICMTILVILYIVLRLYGRKLFLEELKKEIKLCGNK